VQAARAQADEFLVGTPLDNGDIDLRQSQFSRQHKTCRASSSDNHRMLGHRHTPVGTTPVVENARGNASPSIGSTPHEPHVGNTRRISRLPSFGFGFEARLCGTSPVLPQAPGGAVYWKWKERGTSFFLCGAASPLLHGGAALTLAVARSSSVPCFFQPAEIFSAPLVQAPSRSARNCFALQIA